MNAPSEMSVLKILNVKIAKEAITVVALRVSKETRVKISTNVRVRLGAMRMPNARILMEASSVPVMLDTTVTVRHVFVVAAMTLFVLLTKSTLPGAYSLERKQVKENNSVCYDIDECHDNLHNCTENQLCENSGEFFNCTFSV